jgi:NAD(P)-dependent dehydrogenase (short-subunit alcohol dehydrogenase family)
VSWWWYPDNYSTRRRYRGAKTTINLPEEESIIMSATGLERFSLKDKNALIIGGTSGIGRQIALAYASVGARLAIVGRSQHKLDETVNTLTANGSDCKGFIADVADAAQLDDLISKVIGHFGKIDILLNAQGVTEIKPAETFTREE